MNDLYKLFLSVLKEPATGWVFALALILYFLRNRIANIVNAILDAIASKTTNKFSYRRFEPIYRTYIRNAHLYMKVVGIRTEEERRPKITNAYVPLKLTPKGSSIEHSVSFDEVVKNNSYSVVLGEPGAGKSTLLDYLIITYTEPQAKKRINSVPASTRKTRTPYPIYVPLRRCLRDNKTLLADILDEKTGILPESIYQKMPKKFIEYCIEHGNAIILLDGLDEVADEETYHVVTRKVNTFVELYPKNKVVVTCRKAGWRGDLAPDFQIYSVLPLNAQQQEDFIHKWYVAVTEYASHNILAEDQRFQRGVEQETSQLSTLIKVKDRLKELASNPLMLSLMCLVHKQRKNLPRGRVALYRECLDILLELWDRTDKEFYQEYPTTDQKKLLLRRVAYNMHVSGAKEIERKQLESFVLKYLPDITDDITPAEVVRQIEVRSGLMVERSIDKLTFSHLTFQEFLIVDYLNTEQEGNIALETITDWPTWREPLLLMCGMKNIPMPLVEDLFKKQPLFAIYGIAEVEPTKLDIPKAQELVDNVIDSIQRKAVEINEILPALINLLSIERNPFGESVIDAIHKYTHGSSTEELSSIVEALSRLTTRESARILLSLLTKFDLSSRKNLIIQGLTRIGDPSVYEVEAWKERKELSEEQFFAIIAQFDSLLSTKVFWKAYHLEPPPGKELEWAESWALRLANTENDAVLRSELIPEPEVLDSVIWPYRKNDRSALAQVTQKVVNILYKTYGSIEAIESASRRLSAYSLRVRIPLALKIRMQLRKEKLDKRYETKELCDDRLPFALIDKDNWYGIARGIKYKTVKRNNLLPRVLLTAFFIVAIIFALPIDFGIVALLPPNGNIINFWLWLPLWSKISLPLGVPILPFLGCIIYTLQIKDTKRTLMEFIKEEGLFLLYFFLLALLIVLILVPAVYFFIFLTISIYLINHWIITKDNPDKDTIAFIIGPLIFSPICLFLHVHGSKMWISKPNLSYILITITIWIGFAVIFSWLADVLFENGLESYLKKHPHGREVLDEFERKNAIDVLPDFDKNKS